MASKESLAFFFLADLRQAKDHRYPALALLERFK